MKTILGLSIARARIGWVLVDAAAPDERALDDDAFDIGHDDDVAARGAAAARSAEAIAAATGHDIVSIAVTWCGDTEDDVHEMIAMLGARGFADVRLVPSGESDCAGIDPLDEAYRAADAVAAGEIARTIPVTEQPGERRTKKVTLRLAAAAIGAIVVVGAVVTTFFAWPTHEQTDGGAVGQPQMVSAHVPLTPTHPPQSARPAPVVRAESSYVEDDQGESVSVAPAATEAGVDAAVDQPYPAPVAVAAEPAPAAVNLPEAEAPAAGPEVSADAAAAVSALP